LKQKHRQTAKAKIIEPTTTAPPAHQKCINTSISSFSFRSFFFFSSLRLIVGFLEDFFCREKTNEERRRRGLQRKKEGFRGVDRDWFKKGKRVV
jgi:hypothetical protein